MNSSRLSFFQKNIRYNKALISLLKCFDRKRYYEEKRKRAQLALKHFSENYRVPEGRSRGHPQTFKHSGNAGDIIYALPTVQALVKSECAAVLIALGEELKNKTLTHPLGGVMMNEAMLAMLQPLLLAQPYVSSVEVYDGRSVDFDLDSFRRAPIPVDRMSIARWYFYLFAVTADLSKPWLTVDADCAYASRLVVARSMRYRNLALDYSLLARYGSPVFVGVESEYADFKKYVPQAEWVQVHDFLQMARVIAGARLFVGNQSFPFAIAEALKIPRILEVDPAMPNVIPVGARAHDVLFQDQFARVLGELWAATE
jgi:hypothetical protein